MPEWAMQLLGMLVGAGSVYGAIRADLAELREKAESAARAAVEAHARIDSLLMANMRNHD
jgi:hypothetical protein